MKELESLHFREEMDPWKNIAYQKISLSDCNQEPIQFCGAIQSFGWLLVCDFESETVAAASENCADLFSLPIIKIIGTRVSDFLLLSNGHAEYFLKNILTDEESKVKSFTIKHSGELLFASCYVKDSMIFLELELPLVEPATTDLVQQLKNIVHLADQQSDIKNMLQEAAVRIKSLTGFDRVMFYRFEPNGDGHVLAEALNSELTSYLGL